MRRAYYVRLDLTKSKTLRSTSSLIVWVIDNFQHGGTLTPRDRPIGDFSTIEEFSLMWCSFSRIKTL